MQELSKLELDSITEIMGIGAGHASKALSQMIDKRIKIRVPDVEMRSLEKIPEVLGNPEEVVVTVYVGLKSKEMDGHRHVGSLVFVYPMESAIELSALLLEKEDYKVDTSNTELDEMQISALEETSNILSGASLAAISKVLDVEIIETLPYSSYDSLGATLSSIIAEIASKTQKVLAFKTSFEIEDHRIKSYFMLLLEPRTLKQLINRVDDLFHDLLADYVEEEYTETG
ncbi:MAG: hypothetical protein B6U72_03225 [Candidatus Altiarchaeales archaeon ex4484_2]|nr:MAG: hypothetical protein B6U72_03225 [Candidatus Altiarchaeales archaeon ex4484_2]